MARTTAEDVEAIIKVKSSVDLTPFIEFASELVDDQCLESDYTDLRLEMIERLLAAHFYTVRDPRRTLQHAGAVREFFQSKVDYGLRTSHYGQQAIVMDTAGNLAALDNSLKIVTKPLPGGGGRTDITWLGTEDD